MPTAISWADDTWNPVMGCAVTSPACTECYAMKMAARLERMGMGRYAGLTMPSKAGPVWTGRVVSAPEHTLLQPLHWRRPRRIFVVSMGDLFHAGVSDAVLDRIWVVMALAPWHTFLVLTKRTERMRAYLSAPDVRSRWEQAANLLPAGRSARALPWPLPNVHIGCTVEDRRRAAERLPDLLATPAAVRWVSYEPALEDVDFSRVALPNGETLNAIGRLGQIIVGGESHQSPSKARAFDLGWARDVLRQTREGPAGTAFYFKQTGSRAFQDGRPYVVRGKGDDPEGWPEDLRVQEMPLAPAAVVAAWRRCWRPSVSRRLNGYRNSQAAASVVSALSLRLAASISATAQLWRPWLLPFRRNPNA